MRLAEPNVLMATGIEGDLAVNGRLLDEERLAAARLFHFAVGQLGDFQLGGDRFADTDQLARLLEGVQKLCV